jgi:hypothetical protein
MRLSMHNLVPTSRPAQALTIMELLVSVSVMTVIVIGLYSMFAYTQNALRANVTQVDVFDSGRAASDMIGRELEELSACGLRGRPNLQAIRTDAALVQTDLDNMTPLRTNVLQEVFFLTLFTNKWTGIGYRVAGVDGVGTLYRFAITANAHQLATNDLLSHFHAAEVDPQKGTISANLHRVSDGVIHFRLVAYDQSGRRLDVNEPLGFTNFLRQVLRPGQNPPTNSAATIFLRPDVAGARPNQTEFFFTGNALPAYLELEIGVLERTTFQQYLSLRGTPLAQKFLRERANKVHLFRERVPIRTDVQ